MKANTDHSLVLLRRVAKQQKTRSRIFALFGGGALIVVGGLVANAVLATLHGLDEAWNYRPENRWGLIGGIAMVVQGVLWIALSWRDHRVLNALATPGVAPVKVFIREVETIGAMHSRSVTLVMALTNGKRTELRLGFANKDPRLDETGRALVRELARAYPTASVGWSTNDVIDELARITSPDVKMLAELRAIQDQRYRNDHLPS